MHNTFLREYEPLFKIPTIGMASQSTFLLKKIVNTIFYLNTLFF